MSQAKSARVLIAVLVFVGALAWVARELNNARITYAPGGDASQGWFSFDPDSHYHMRRVERAIVEGLPIAETDARMNFPDGAKIPWPPYYAYLLYALLAPFAPDDPVERSDFIERTVASLPCAFAVLTSMIVAAAAWRLTRRASTSWRTAAALIAGGSFAWLRISFDYSAPGIGDHHAWVSMLLAALLALTARALESESLDSRASSVRIGIAAGLVAGVLVGSWVGALVYVLVVQLALGLLLFAHARTPRAGTASLGLAFHGALLASLAPAVLSSPWKDDLPWIVVNLSWFHLVEPLLGGLVFVPLVFLRPSSSASRAWPWLVAASLALLGIAIAYGDFALARSVREGFAWVSRANTFMAFISESQPLAWGQIGGVGPLKHALGFAVFAAPFVWLWMLWRALTTRNFELAPWLIATAVLAAQALAQRRFAEQFGVAMTLGLGWLVADFAGERRALRALSASIALPLALALVVLAQWPSIALTWERIASGERLVHDGFAQRFRGFRDLYVWLHEHTPATEDYSVLASWDHGHSLEWVAGRATVATNFGSYVGEDSYLDPWRFFLEESPARAEELLERRGARYVLITSDFTKDLAVMTRLLRERERSQYLIAREGEYGRPGPRYYRSMAGRLMLGGRVGDLELSQAVGDSLDFLRLVYVSPMELGVVPQVPYSNGPFPAGWIWERVPGATLEARGSSGETLWVSLEVGFESSNARLKWVGSAAVPNGADRVRLRIPYCTDGANGDARALGEAHWSIGGREGTIAIPRATVERGGIVEIARQ